MKSAPESVVDATARAIRDAIHSGQLAPGRRLVVADLRAQFGISAGPVREAITRLAGEGLIDLIPNRGALVRSFSEREMRELFEVREAIEGMVARLAALNAHRADYAIRLQTLMSALEADTREQVDHLPVRRQAFHDLLYEMAGNTTLRETALRLSFPGYSIRYIRLLGPDRSRASLAEHQSIAAAILAGDAAASERVMRQHVRHTALAIHDALEADPDFRSHFFAANTVCQA